MILSENYSFSVNECFILVVANKGTGGEGGADVLALAGLQISSTSTPALYPQQHTAHYRHHVNPRDSGLGLSRWVRIIHG